MRPAAMNITDSIIVELLETMTAAIRMGDWRVDGRCDPDMAMARAESYLKQRGVMRAEREMAEAV